MPPKNKANGGRKPKQQEDEDEAEFLLEMELIEFREGYPTIYDITLPGHKKEYLWNQVWKNISKALFLPGKSRSTWY